MRYFMGDCHCYLQVKPKTALSAEEPFSTPCAAMGKGARLF
jgi:hypothetical protein